MKVNSNILRNAISQRKTKNPWEAKLWQHLRAKRFLGHKFKRQVPIGKYIVDFCCHNSRLVIELDGGQHNEDEHKDKDQRKESYLKKENFKVVRFWNNEIDYNLDGVLEVVRRNLEDW